MPEYELFSARIADELSPMIFTANERGGLTKTHRLE